MPPKKKPPVKGKKEPTDKDSVAGESDASGMLKAKGKKDKANEEKKKKEETPEETKKRLEEE